MKKGTRMPTKRQAIMALDACADLLSDASPNQHTDPWSWWGRKRSIQNMTPKQAQSFALQALVVLEFNYKKLK